MSLIFSVNKVKELMTTAPILISPSATLQQAAKKMDSIGCGILPVGTEQALRGMITDRDIVIRAIAKGKNPAHEKVADYMTKEVYSCNENDTLEQAAEQMHLHKVSRLVVRDESGKTTGILSFEPILRADANPQELAAIVKHAAGPVSF